MLVFAGCGSAVLAADHVGYAGVALAFGLTLLAMIYTLGPISGAHLNPAVTVGMTLSGKFPAERVAGYLLAQVLGGIVAALVLFIVANGTGHFDATTNGFSTNGYGPRSPGGYGLFSSFLVEVVMTSFLVLTILGSTDIKAPVGFAGIAIGLVLTAIHLVSIPVTNTSVNPARSIGPALFGPPGSLTQLWLFVVAPLLGGALASFFYWIIRPIEPVAQLTVKHAVQALPTEQQQRLRKALGEDLDPAKPLEKP